AGLFESLVKAEGGHRLAPLARAVQLEHQRLAVAVVEAGAEPGARGRAGDAGLARDRVAVAPHCRRQRPAHQADLAAEQRAIDLLADAGGPRIGQGRERPAKGEDGAGLIGDRDDAGFQRLARRRIGLGDAAERLGHRVGPGQCRVWAPGAVTRDRHVDEPRVHLAQFVVAEAVLLGRTGPAWAVEQATTLTPWSGPCGCVMSNGP